MKNLVFTPTDFVALVNQTLDFAYPHVTIAGELANFKVSRAKWVYFDLKDNLSTVRFFGTVYSLPGPLEDGMLLEVSGRPQLSPKYGFNITVQSIKPVGEGSIKRAADLLRLKLEKEGLFDQERKRPLLYPPSHIGLITSKESAAYEDFCKILNSRFGGLKVSFSDVSVQGESAGSEIIQAIEAINQLSDVPEIIVIVRGGGSREDLAVFDSEQIVRAVSLSRIPTLVAIGHETDISLAELAADLRCSTPSHAAQSLVPDKKHEKAVLENYKNSLRSGFSKFITTSFLNLDEYKELILSLTNKRLNEADNYLNNEKILLAALSPDMPLKKGYILARRSGQIVSSAKKLKTGDKLLLQFKDGQAETKVKSVK